MAPSWLAATPVVALETHYPECYNEALLRVWVPTEHVGLVIGKSGATVNALKKKTGVNVQVVLKGTDEGSVEGGSADDVSLWTPLTCAGTPHGLQTAWRDIIGLIEEEEDVVAEFKVKFNKHSTLIGPKGATIRRLSASTGVRIHVPKFVAGGGSESANKNRSTSDRAIALEGPAPQVFACMRAILEVCRHGTDAEGVPNQLTNTSDDRLPDGSCPKTFPFAESIVSHLATAPSPGGVSSNSSSAAARSPKNASANDSAATTAQQQPPAPPSPPKVIEPTECRVLKVPLSKLPLIEAKSPLPGANRGGRSRPPMSSFSQVAKVTGTKIKVKGAPHPKARAAAPTDGSDATAAAALADSSATATATGGAGSDRRRRVADSSAAGGEDGGDGVVASVMDDIVGAAVASDGGDGDDDGISEDENNVNDEDGNEDEDEDDDEFADATGSGDEAEAMVAGVISNDDDDDDEEEEESNNKDKEDGEAPAPSSPADDGATCDVSIEGPESRVAAAAAALNLLLEGQPLREATAAAKDMIRESGAGGAGGDKKKRPRGGKHVKKRVGSDGAPSAGAADGSAPAGSGAAGSKATGRRGGGRNHKAPTNA